MGCFKIVIEGIGPHHNVDNEHDADVIIANAVAELLESGHAVSKAEFSVEGGDTTDILADVLADEEGGDSDDGDDTDEGDGDGEEEDEGDDE